MLKAQQRAHQSSEPEVHLDASHFHLLCEVLGWVCLERERSRSDSLLTADDGHNQQGNDDHQAGVGQHSQKDAYHPSAADGDHSLEDDGQRQEAFCQIRGAVVHLSSSAALAHESVQSHAVVLGPSHARGHMAAVPHARAEAEGAALCYVPAGRQVEAVRAQYDRQYQDGVFPEKQASGVAGFVARCQDRHAGMVVLGGQKQNLGQAAKETRSSVLSVRSRRR
jgi:hypothetical protein